MSTRARKQILRNALLTGAILIAAAPAAAAAQARTYDIPAQPLSSALKTYGRTSGHHLLFTEDLVRGKSAPRLKGSYEPEEALDRLLRGSGLRAERAANGAIMIRAAQPISQNTAPATHDSVAAAEEEESEAEIVVTARKREERLLDVPIAVTAFAGRTLERRNAQSLVDVLQESPGVAIVDLGGGVTQTAIRGIAPVFGANANGFYLDELPFTGVTVAVEPDVRAWDLDRVEVLRGPQGTLFGEGSMGGTVRVLTRDADLDDWGVKAEGSLSTTHDGGENGGVKAAVNLPIVPGVLAVRVAGTYEDYEGWVDDPVTGETNLNDQRIGTFRAKATFQPTSRLTIKGSYWLYDNRSGGGSSATDEGNVPQLSRPIRSDIGYQLYGLSAAYDFDTVSLFWSSSFNHFTSEKESRYYGGDYAYDIDVDTSAHELRLASNGNGPFKWTLGAYRRTAERDDDYLLAAFGLSGTEHMRSTASALYGEATYTIRDAFDLTAGLRYFHDRVRTAPTSSSTGAKDAVGTFEHVSPRFILTWRPSSDWSIYASAANGFRSGQAQFASSLAVAEVLGIDLPEKTNPDSIWTYEIGAKARLLDGRLVLEGALYQSRWKDVPVIIALGTTGLTGLLNSEGTETRGVELSATANLTRGLNVSASAGYIDAEYSADVPGSALKEGDRFRQLPRFTGSLGVDYRRPISERMSAMFNLNGQYNGRRLPDRATNRPSDPITRVDGQIGIQTDHWGLFLFAKNLLNDDGAIRQRNVASFGGITDIVAERLQPRTIGLRLTVETGRP